MPIKSLKDIPNDVTLTPQQKTEVYRYFLQKGKERDFQDFKQAYNQGTSEEKQNLIERVRNDTFHDKQAGRFGNARRNLEAIYSLYAEPAFRVPEPLPIRRNDAIGVQEYKGLSPLSIDPSYLSALKTELQKPSYFENLQAELAMTPEQQQERQAEQEKEKQQQQKEQQKIQNQQKNDIIKDLKTKLSQTEKEKIEMQKVIDEYSKKVEQSQSDFKSKLKNRFNA